MTAILSAADVAAIAARPWVVSGQEVDALIASHEQLRKLLEGTTAELICERQDAAALRSERDDLRAAIPVLAIQVQHIRENLADGNVDGAGELLSELGSWVSRWQASQGVTPDA